MEFDDLVCSELNVICVFAFSIDSAIAADYRGYYQVSLPVNYRHTVMKQSLPELPPSVVIASQLITIEKQKY